MARVKVRLHRKPNPNVTEKAFKTFAPKINPILQKGADLRYKVTKTWSADSKPTFMPFVEMLNQALRWGLKVDAKPAPSANVSVWRLLNDGTDVMRVKMTEPFVRKTIPFQFSSGAGVGGLAYVDPSLSNPGIVAGKWDELANAKIQAEVEAALDDAIR